MPPSDDDLAAQLCRLDDTAAGDRRAIATRVHRTLIEDPIRWEELTPAAVEACRDALDAPDPAVRSVAAFVLRHVAVHRGEWADRSIVAGEVLTAFEDPDPKVRQAAADPNYLKDIVAETVADDEAFEPVSNAHLARTLFDGLCDPESAVRRRIGKVFFSHGEVLLRSHPDREAAVAVLAEAFGDPLDGYCTYTRPVASPRMAALKSLVDGFGAYDGTSLAEHADSVGALLVDDRRQVRYWAARLLAVLVDADALDPGTVADDVIAAVERGRYPHRREESATLALRVALAREDAVDPVYRHFRSRVTAENTRRENWRADDADVVALSRLIRAADRSFDPPMETLAVAVARDRAATDETDPLALVADDHPEFVADQLRKGYRLLVEGDIDYNSRFYRSLVVDVAERNPRAIDGVPELLAENFDDGTVRKVLTELVEAYPDLSAHFVPRAFDACDWEAPLRYQRSELIERTVDQWGAVSDDLVAALVETVGATRSGSHSYDRRRRAALRALIVLDERGHSVLPERFEPFFDHYDEGAFDEDRDDPLDPLETGAAEAAGLV